MAKDGVPQACDPTADAIRAALDNARDAHPSVKAMLEAWDDLPLALAAQLARELEDSFALPDDITTELQ